MKTRLITAGIAAVIAIGLMALGELCSYVILVAITIVAFLMEFEMLTSKNLHKDLFVLIICLAGTVATVAMSTLEVWFIPFYSFTTLLFCTHVFRHKKNSTSDILFAYSGTILICLSMMCLARLSCVQGRYTSFLLVVALGCPWFADSAAYFVGSAIGKHKLCPNISPKKTWEGAIGGALGAILGSLLFGAVYQFLIYNHFYNTVHINYLALVIVGVYCAVVSVMGDLTFSLIKRECKIKDFGSIMPGHGGMLDRFDSIIFTSPFVLFISYSMGFITTT